MRQIERWGLFEAAVNGKSDGNPFMDYSIEGTFVGEREKVTVAGFYDGEGIWRVRFMPSFEGRYTYTLGGSAIDTPVTGEFEAVAPTGNNHGPVRVVDETALAYADGTPHYSFGTTCYAWVHQPMGLQEQTIETLQKAPFNKLRFCVFPKYYVFNHREPLTWPFERGHGEGLDPALVSIEREDRAKREAWERNAYLDFQPAVEDYDFDYTRPNVEHFRRFDLRVAQLQQMGIEADLILMHPYDRWGMNEMSAAACDAYIRYVVARYGAYRNIWWSLSNEYDFIPTRTVDDWERCGRLISECDPYRHLCSIHNGGKYYDYSRPWVTHLSLQRIDFYKTTEFTDEYLERFRKPVVWDEICYEGNISLGWGNISGQELVRRFWEAFLRGGHAGHGETFMDPEDILWWSHGGILKGESVPRLAFLRKIMAQTPGRGIKRCEGMFDEVVGCAADQPEDYQIHYLGLCQPVCRMLPLPTEADYQVEIIDTWNMTVTSAGIHRGVTRIDLPGNQYMAIRVRKVSENESKTHT